MTQSGWNTVVIIPLNDQQSTFAYTLEVTRSLIIKRKLGVLILIPSREEYPKVEIDLGINGHECNIQKIFIFIYQNVV